MNDAIDINNPNPNPNPNPNLIPNNNNVNQENTFNFSFKSQNVRSLNVSTRSTLTTEKIYAITQSKEDIIFICDTRLNEEHQKPAITEI